METYVDCLDAFQSAVYYIPFQVTVPYETQKLQLASERKMLQWDKFIILV